MARRKKITKARQDLYEGLEPGTLVQYFGDDAMPQLRKRT